MRIGVIVLSRHDSSRLPGKAMKQINNKPMIDYVLERALLIENICETILATSSRDVDNSIIERAKNFENISYYRGSIDDVSKRYLMCMEEYDLDAAIRVNGDSPIHSHDLINKSVKIYKNKKPDILTNVFPRSYPKGMTVEIISRKAMNYAYNLMNEKSDKEHVSKYFYENPEKFEILNISQMPTNHSNIQLSVDTSLDFERMKWIILKLGDNYREAEYNKIIELYKKYEKKNVT